KKGIGPFWTKRNRIVSVEKLFDGGNLKSITLKYMKKYGWENVRGYAWEQWTLKTPPKALLKMLENEQKQLNSKLRKKQKYRCFKCGKKLYEIDEDIPIRKWSKTCWRCKRETQVVSYTLEQNEFGSVIGSHENIDEIIKSEYFHVDKVFSKTLGGWLIGNKCYHCGAYQGKYYIEHELVWDAVLYYYDNSYDTVFPVERTLSPGYLMYLDGNKNNKDLNNLALLCLKCYKKSKIR
ncbi:hypothetical protein LCGC14_2741480, partial [marine sediment metagenome]